ncbi:MAG: hypothetical protein VCA36_10095 [Opitutales bacterium]
MKTHSYFLLSAMVLVGIGVFAQDAPPPPAPPDPGTPLPGTPLPGTPLPGIPTTPLGSGSLDAEANKTAEKGVSIQVANELRAVISTNIHAWGTKNLNLLRSTTHSESPLVETSDLMARYIFARFKLKYTVTKLLALKADDEEAEVEVHQTTEKLDGPAFRNNRAVVIHTLKKENGKWKMWSSQVMLLQFLK